MNLILTRDEEAAVQSGGAGCACCAVVMYHYVRPLNAPSPGASDRRAIDAKGIRGLAPEAFEAQIRRLCRWGEPVSWPRFYDWHQGDGTLPQRSFLLTFDDGLRDHAEYVAPILGRLGLSALFFIPSRILEEKTLLPAHRLHLLLETLSAEELWQEWASIPMNGGWRPAHAHSAGRASSDRPGAALGASLAPKPATSKPAGFAEGSTGFETSRGLKQRDSGVEEAQRLYPYETPARAQLKYWLHHALPREQRDLLLADAFARYVGSGADWHARWYLAHDDLRGLVARGHALGGHGHGHEPLTRLSFPEARADLEHCFRVTAPLAGPGPLPLSFPFGRVDASAKEAARQAGFSMGFTTESRLSGHEPASFGIPRIDTINLENILAEERE